MILCPRCSQHVPDGSRFCLTCGTALVGSSAPTLPRTAPAPPSLHPAFGDAGFVPGTVLAERYRLVGLLGRGGMGEVYRADDLKLGEPVALKLLPAALSRQSELLVRFHQEVRIARRISHPNVCRVFDIGEVDGQHFLSMEYVDGENLASLLRRIGHLPAAKAVEIARQLCAGLAAAHEKGVLHRDLKPANVMIDGLGRVRITDFGLAGLEGELAERETLSGTPAYMAPEQLAGGQVSVKSDLYSLGLILYEAFTGERPFRAETTSDLARQQKERTRVPPAAVVPGIDPLTEQAILRCLAYEPVDRPASAREVVAALPAAAALEPCPECGFLSPGGFTFCGKCGTALDETAGEVAAAQPEAASREVAEATTVTDRRQLTALFCDLAGSTALAEQLDPEKLRAVLHAYQKAAGEVVERFGGHVAQRLGDGLRAYFGYPRAHEDDARRAVHAGLGILAAVDALNQRLGRGVQLAVRASAHTGTVVAGEMVTGTTREHLATGPALNVAALLLRHAAPGALLLSEPTWRLVRGFFVCEELGPYELKGFSEPLEVYRVDGEAEWGSRFELAVSGVLTPMVGRDLELALLDRALARVRDGRGQAVLITGEEGIGKSRLVYEIRNLLADRPVPQWLCRCSPYYRHSAFQPLIELLAKILRFHREDSPASRLAKLERRLTVDGLHLSTALPPLASLLSLPVGESELPAAREPASKEEVLHLLLTLLLKLADEEPVILVVEDLHWIDPSSLALLDLLMTQVPAVSLLLLLTARPAFTPRWGTPAHLTPITLDRLSEGEVLLMADKLAGGKPLPEAVRRELAARTDGNPLAVEELTRMVLESGVLVEGEERYELAGPLPALAIPATLQDSLEARLDRLGPFHEVAQLAAVLGRELTYELLRAVSPLAESTLQDGLRRLVDTELLLQRGLLPEATFIFKHALIQEAAYRSLLASDRRRLHGRVAEVLVERFSEIARAQPELVAHHYSEAGRTRRAVGYWLAAGKLAAERSAREEAAGHLRRAIALLATLPAAAGRDGQLREAEAMLAALE